MPSTSERFQARLELSNWFLQMLTDPAPPISHAQAPGLGHVNEESE